MHAEAELEVVLVIHTDRITGTALEGTRAETSV